MTEIFTSEIQRSFTELCEAKSKTKTIRKAIKQAYEESQAYKEAKADAEHARKKLAEVREIIQSSILRDLRDLEDAVEEEKSVGVAVEVIALREMKQTGLFPEVKDLSGQIYLLKPSVKAEKAL